MFADWRVQLFTYGKTNNNDLMKLRIRRPRLILKYKSAEQKLIIN